jgi:hypothetical protein
MALKILPHDQYHDIICNSLFLDVNKGLGGSMS